jgi:hypothetical protein
MALRAPGRKRRVDEATATPPRNDIYANGADISLRFSLQSVVLDSKLHSTACLIINFTPYMVFSAEIQI